MTTKSITASEMGQIGGKRKLEIYGREVFSEMGKKAMAKRWGKKKKKKKIAS